MARITLRIYLSDELAAVWSQLCFLHGQSRSAFIRPHIAKALLTERSVTADPLNTHLHQKLILRAMQHQNVTVTEIVKWTGLNRAIVQTTLSELVEAERVKQVRPSGKIVGYFLKETVDGTTKD